MDITWPISQIILSCISFIFTEIEFINYHYCVIFILKSMSICNDYTNYEETIIQRSLVFKHMF